MLVGDESSMSGFLENNSSIYGYEVSPGFPNLYKVRLPVLFYEIPESIHKKVVQHFNN
jgi:hypothetical protein